MFCLPPGSCVCYSTLGSLFWGRALGRMGKTPDRPNQHSAQIHCVHPKPTCLWHLLRTPCPSSVLRDVLNAMRRVAQASAPKRGGPHLCHCQLLCRESGSESQVRSVTRASLTHGQLLLSPMSFQGRFGLRELGAALQPQANLPNP